MDIKKISYLRLIVAIILIMGVGFAFLTTNLSITGSSKLKGNTWNVYFANIIDGSSSSTSSTATITEENTTIEFNLDLRNPGEDFTFYVDVVNDGTLDAMLDTVEVTGIAEELKKYLTIKTAYVDGIDLTKYDLLKAGESETLNISFVYGEEIDLKELPKTDIELGLSLNINYNQSDSNAKAREIGEVNEDAPVINNDITVIEGSNSWSKSLSISYEITDEDVMRNVMYCVSDTTCTPNTVAELENNTFIYNFESSTEPQKICIAATDIFNNQSTECSDTYYVDSEAPSLTSFNTTPQDGKVTVEVTATDNISGVSTYYYSKNNGQTYVSSTSSNYTFTSLATGTYTIVAYAEDAAGNKSEESNTEVSIVNHSVYAMLYEDGTLRINSTGSIDSRQNLVKNYGKLSSRYTGNSTIPWKNEVSSITIVNIEDSIYPTSTAYWFYNLSNATDISNISNLDTSYVTNMEFMFNNCSSLTTLDVSRWDTKNVKRMEYMFTGCSSLIELNTNNWDVSKVEKMYYMFQNDSALKRVKTTNWNVLSVNNMESMFNGCSSLEEVDVSNWNVSNVLYMNAMFSGCSSLTELNTSNWEPSKVIRTDSMFYNASKLSTLNVSKWRTPNNTSTAHMFSGCTSLTTLDVSNWIVDSVDNMEAMFNGASKLNGLDLSKWNTNNVTNFGYMLSNASSSATNKVWYYGPNSTNIYNNRNTAGAGSITFQYKTN